MNKKMVGSLLLSVASLLAVAAPVYAQTAPLPPVTRLQTICYVNVPMGSGLQSLRTLVGTDEPVYICDSHWFDGLVPVTKPWFKAHCTKKPGMNNGRPEGVATCDAWAPTQIVIPVKEMARPHNHKAKLKAIGYGAASLGVLALCVIGGCGFMGGGL